MTKIGRGVFHCAERIPERLSRRRYDYFVGHFGRQLRVILDDHLLNMLSISGCTALILNIHIRLHIGRVILRVDYSVYRSRLFLRQVESGCVLLRFL